MPAISAHSELTENTVNANESHPASGLVSYEYDNDGAPVREVFDSNGDGVPEATLAVHRNRNNTEEKWELNLNGDGVSDGVYTSRFDSYENTLQQELDMDGDGIPDKIYVSTYDSNGNRIRRETDTDGDGAINEVQINEYYGADNTQLRKHNDMQEDKVIGETELFMSFMSGVAAQTLVEQ